MFVACGIWCLADVLSISPLLEQTEKQFFFKTSLPVAIPVLFHMASTATNGIDCL